MQAEDTLCLQACQIGSWIMISPNPSCVTDIVHPFWFL